MSFNPNIDPGPGYRLVQPGEVLKKGDQVYAPFLSGPEWQNTDFVGSEVGSHPCDCTYRRKIRLSYVSGYRVLDEGELIIEGDEVSRPERPEWSPTLSAGRRVGNEGAQAVYRRKIETGEPDSDPDVGPGYRKLLRGEVILPTDECYCITGWEKTLSAGLKVGVPGTLGCVYRRKVEPAKPETTVFAEVSPEACQAEAGVKGWTPPDSWGKDSKVVYVGTSAHIARLQRKIAKQKAEIARLTSALEDARAIVGYAKEVLTNS